MRAKLLQTILGLASRYSTPGRILPQAAHACCCSPLPQTSDVQQRHLHVLPRLCKKGPKYPRVKRGKKPKREDCYTKKKPPAICMAERCICLPGTYIPSPRLPICKKVTMCPCRDEEEKKPRHHKKKRKF